MRLTMVLMVFSMSVAGCQKPTLQLEIEPPRVHEYVDAGTRITKVNSFVDVKDLDAAVREYARENNIDFDFRGTSGSFTVTRERECLAEGWYSSGLWKPVLSVEIGWDGHVKSHQIAVGVCGTCLDLLNGSHLDPKEDED